MVTTNIFINSEGISTKIYQPRSLPAAFLVTIRITEMDGTCMQEDYAEYRFLNELNLITTQYQYVIVEVMTILK